MSQLAARPIRDFMTPKLLAVAPTASLNEAYETLRSAKISCLAVLDGGKLVGLLSRTDILKLASESKPDGSDPRQLYLQLPELPVAEVMHKGAILLPPEASLAQAANTMVEEKIHRVFVGEAEHVRGVLSTLDLMKAIANETSDKTISEFMSEEVVSIDIESSLSEAAESLREAKVSGLVVVENEWPIGVFTQVEALAARGQNSDLPLEEAMDPALICMPVDTSMQRAAKQAVRMRVRRIVASENRHMRGILSGMDFARYLASLS